MFGWPSLSGMLQDLGNYAEGCPAAASAQGGVWVWGVGRARLQGAAACGRCSGSKWPAAAQQAIRVAEFQVSRCTWAGRRRFIACCPPPPLGPLALHADANCTSQDTSLSLVWTLGIFTLNCGPVAMGFVLDYLGPKLTGILGGCVCSCSCSCTLATLRAHRRRGAMHGRPPHRHGACTLTVASPPD